MKNIGIPIHKAEDGKEVYYYPYHSERGNSEPVKTRIKGKVYEIGGQPTCFVEGIAGVVALSHLSFDYYPEYHEKPKTRSQLRYQEYMKCADCFNSFLDFLKYDTNRRKGLCE